MQTKFHNLLAAIGLCLVLIASACSSDASDTADGGFAAAIENQTDDPTAVPPVPTIVAPTVEPTEQPAPTAAPAPGLSGGSGEAIELVATTIDKFGIASVVPAGWTEVADGTFEGPNGQVALGAFATWATPDLSAVGLVPLDTVTVGSHEWELQGVEAGGIAIFLAVTEVADTTYFVQLVAPPDAAEDFIDAVGNPALEAFEIVDPDILVDDITLNYTTVAGRDLAYASSTSPSSNTTVVFESGLGDGMAVWADVLPAVAEFADVFAYDRPGYGRSTPATSSRDAATMVAELRDGLRSAGHEPPFVLVGHSLGGTVMDLFARTYPGEVEGLVLVDARHHDYTERCLAEVDDGEECVPPAEAVELFPTHVRDEWLQFENTEEQLRSATAHDPALMLTVITAGLADPGGSIQAWELWQDAQQDYAAMLPDSNHVVASRSDHHIPTREPRIIVEAVADMLGASLADGAEATATGSLQAIADELVADSTMPAVGITVFDDEQIIESAVAGVRRAGDSTEAELDDKFSIGSNAKAMTASLVATFVDEGIITWDTTVDEVFGDSLSGIHPEFETVSFRQLLSHTAGINDEADDSWTSPLLDADLDVTEQRQQLADIALARPQDHDAGQYMYSNVGYTIVGAMLEHMSGSSWESLMQARVFDVLEMSSCGFQAPGSPGELDQPWGHLAERGGEALDPGDFEADYPAGIAPAGLVHCNMADWTRFLQSQIRGFAGQHGEWLSPESFAAMQTAPAGSNYALGWVRRTTSDGGVALQHNGSNERFTAEVWIVPGEAWGLLMVTNLGEALANPTLVDAGEAIFATRQAS